ncbi:MAG: GNAT family N-acetyltransferase [Lachnospiraceae bacterium]|nr:GNAT family N-acetyltransferase [Lachnospiraceae bacterium]
MNIRRATQKDMPGLNRLLYQVLMVHHNGRPDLFKANAKKYTDEELQSLLADETRPVFAAVDENEEVLGYAFCMLEVYDGDNIHPDMKTLYIDDLCVDETLRGTHVGSTLYQYVLDYARQIGCYNVTLNVWSCNPGAMRFYEKCGLTPYKVGMEKIL